MTEKRCMGLIKMFKNIFLSARNGTVILSYTQTTARKRSESGGRNRFQSQRRYVSNIRVECFKHSPSMFQTFPEEPFIRPIRHLEAKKEETVCLFYKRTVPPSMASANDRYFFIRSFCRSTSHSNRTITYDATTVRYFSVTLISVLRGRK